MENLYYLLVVAAIGLSVYEQAYVNLILVGSLAFFSKKLQYSGMLVIVFLNSIIFENSEWLLLLCTIIYLAPTAASLKTSETQKALLCLSICWLLTGILFQRPIYDIAIVLGVSWFSFTDNTQRSQKEDIYDKYTQLWQENSFLQDQIQGLESQIKSQKAESHFSSSRRMKSLIQKLRQLKTPDGSKVEMDSSVSEFEEEPYYSLTSEIDSADSGLVLSARSSRDSNSLTNDDLKLIIHTLLNQEDVFWHKDNKNAGSEAIGYEAKRVYTQSFDSIVGITQKAFSGSKRKRGLKRLRSTVEESEVLCEILENIGDWDFDTISLGKHTNNPAFEVGNYVFNTLELPKKFNIDVSKLHGFLTLVEKSYVKENHYHNSLHAADVTASTVFLIQNGLERSGNFLEIDVFSLVVAALCHDIGHPGVNNSFLIATSDPLAFKYNDQSVLENMHANKAFRILEKQNCNILESLKSPDFQRFRKTAIAAILATDLQIHFNKISEFKNQLQQKASLEDDKFRILAVQICLKCADIGHGAKTLSLHKNWTAKIQKEFFNQGDLEKEKGVPVSPLFDRDSVVVSSSQVGFLKVLVKPLFEAWSDFVEQNDEEEDSNLAVKICNQNIEQNIEFWSEETLSGNFDLDDY